MNNRKQFVVILVTAGLGLTGVVVGRWILKPRTVEREAPSSRRPAAARPAGAATPNVTSTSPSRKTGNTSRVRPAGKKLVLDPAARAALKLVGSDSEAERYWLDAINNPLLPPDERKDLIEDLNEDGFSDPRNPGALDLPLIATRIRLIEQLMPDALDQINAAAFREAHKDLVNMQARLIRP